MNALILAVLLAVAAAPPFPWKSYTDVPLSVSEGYACEGMADIVTISPEWSALSGAAKDVFVHRTDGNIDFVYLTVGEAKGPITVKRVLTLEEARALFPDPCGWILAVDTKL